MELPSKLFYKNKLTCKASFPDTGPKNLPAIKFVGVTGREQQDEESPSYYNNNEIVKIVEQVSIESNPMIQNTVMKRKVFSNVHAIQGFPYSAVEWHHATQIVIENLFVG